METIQGIRRSDRKRANPTPHTFEPVSCDDLRARRLEHAYIKDDHGRFAQVKDHIRHDVEDAAGDRHRMEIWPL